MRFILQRHSLFILVILVSFFISCIPQKKLRYLQSDTPPRQSDTAGMTPTEHILAPYDLLHVQFVSLTPDMNKVPGFETSSNPGNDAALYLQGYQVDAEGNLSLPLLGEHHVAGLPIDELRNRLTAVARERISLDAEVFVKLINFEVTVLGEVKTPGVIPVYDQRVSVLEAIAMAGDMTVYGDRKNVMLIRETGGKREIRTIDLSRSNMVNEPQFYLQNHDILYIQPLDAKSYGFGQVQWSVIFSSISALLAIFAIVLK